jgi:hypothetical protein
MRYKYRCRYGYGQASARALPGLGKKAKLTNYMVT